MARSARLTLAAGILVLCTVSGCATWSRTPAPLVMANYPHAAEANMTQSPHEHFNQVRNIAAQDGLMLSEDIDLLFMTDRPSRLNRWHTR